MAIEVRTHFTADLTGDGRYQPEGPTVADWLDTNFGKEFMLLFWWELNTVGTTDIESFCWEAVFNDSPAYYVPQLLQDSPYMYEQFRKYVIADFTKASLFQEALKNKLMQELDNVLKDFHAKGELHLLEAVVLAHPQFLKAETKVGGIK